jgi:calpain, invertebrate
MRKTDDGENIPEFEPPQLSNLERKLQILQGEWFEESYFKNDDVAALYSFYQPTQGPFIIVPSFSKEEYTSDFTLSSKYRYYL